jgi:hypothetical protein
VLLWAPPLTGLKVRMINKTREGYCSGKTLEWVCCQDPCAGA